MTKEEIVHMGDEPMYDPECEAVGHVEVTDFDGADVWQGHCSRCGAELFEDKQEQL